MPLKPKTNKITRIWGSAQLTVNLGNYESLKLEVGEERTVDDLKEDEAALAASLWERLETEVKKRIDDYQPKGGGPTCIYYLETMK